METVSLGIHAHLRYGTDFLFFRTNCAVLTSYIRADPRNCRGSRVDVVTLRDQMVSLARSSCGVFTAMAGNKAD